MAVPARGAFRSRTLAALALFAVLIPTIGGALGLQRVNHALEQQVRDAQAAAASTVVHEVDIGVDFAVSFTRAIARRPGFQQSVEEGDLESQREELDNIYSTTPLFHSFGVFDPGGRPVLVFPVPLLSDGTEILQDTSPEVFPPRPVGDDALLVLREPVIGEDGDLTGILVAEISLDKTVPAVRNLRMGETGTATIIDQDRRVLLTGSGERVGQVLDTPELRALVDGWKEGTTTYHSPIVDREEILSFAPVPGRPWAVLVTQARDEVLAPVADLGRAMLTGIGALILVSLLLAYIVSRRLGRYEVRLRESQERFAAVAQNTEDAIIAADGKGDIIYLNPAAEHLFGYPADEAVGSSLTILMPEKYHQLHLEGLRRYLSTREPKVIGRKVELEGRRKDGSEFPVELSLGEWESQGRPFFVGSIRDITERRRVQQSLEENVEELARTNEELQRVNLTTREFVAIASHDLRGPLTSIRGFSSLMEERWAASPDQQKREFIGIISRQADRVSRLVDDLLTVSQIDAGALDTHAEVLRLSETLQEAREAFSEHASDIEISAPDGLELTADRDHLNRILTNYLANAIKYGEPPVEVEAAEQNGWVEIRVRDRGHGVPEEFVPRLFEKFARSDDPEARKEKGTGLGLSIVQGLARANGGEAWYEPNHPSGSCFAVRLPRASTPAGARV